MTKGWAFTYMLIFFRKSFLIKKEEIIFSRKVCENLYEFLKNRMNLRPKINRRLQYKVKDDKLVVKFPSKGKFLISEKLDWLRELLYILGMFLGYKEDIIKEEYKNVKKVEEVLFNSYLWYHSDMGLWYVFSLSHHLNINTCIISNPGQGKSYILKNFNIRNKTSKYVDLNTTVAGLLGEVIYNEQIGKWQWNRQIYNDTVIYIDEFNLLKLEVRDALLSMMSGVLLFNKAGISVSEKIKVSTIVVQNPATENRVFNTEKPLKEQVTTCEPLYDRLHIVYPLMLDIDTYKVEIPRVNFFTRLFDIDALFNLDKIRKDKKLYETFKDVYNQYNKSIRPLQLMWSIIWFNKVFFGVDVEKSIELSRYLIRWKYSDMILSLIEPEIEEFKSLCKEIYKGSKQNYLRAWVRLIRVLTGEINE